MKFGWKILNLLEKLPQVLRGIFLTHTVQLWQTFKTDTTALNVTLLQRTVPSRFWRTATRTSSVHVRRVLVTSKWTELQFGKDHGVRIFVILMASTRYWLIHLPAQYYSHVASTPMNWRMQRPNWVIIYRRWTTVVLQLESHRLNQHIDCPVLCRPYDSSELMSPT